MFWASSGRQQLVMVSRCAVNAIVTGLSEKGFWWTLAYRNNCGAARPICHTACETWCAGEADTARRSTCVSHRPTAEFRDCFFKKFLNDFFSRGWKLLASKERPGKPEAPSGLSPNKCATPAHAPHHRTARGPTAGASTTASQGLCILS